jgi:iron(III) transport system substrate-binding protein
LKEGTSVMHTPHGQSIRWSRRRLLAAAAAWGTTAGLLACQPSAPSPTVTPPNAAPKPEGWDTLVEAARREGSVVAYTGASADIERVFAEDFQRAYPDVKVESLPFGGNDMVSRMMAERQADRYIPDVIVTGSFNNLTILKPAGALAPLKTALALPEVSDTSAWLQNMLWWSDAAEPYTTLNFQGLLATPLFVNPTLVSPSEFTSYWDLLNPKWKGKIASSDIRVTGPGGVPARFIYKHPDLGPEWFERLYSEQDVTFSRDQRQLVDWVVQGRFPILLFVSNTEFTVAKEQGLPIAAVPIERLKEGGAIGPGGGALALAEPAPHPNAAKVFVNWLLSREGQASWQHHTSLPSLRIDIPKTGLIEEYVPNPSYTYVNGGAEEYGRISSDVFADLYTRGMERAGRR